jgi:RNA polymerase sigma-70 factor (ECF subfamily)
MQWNSGDSKGLDALLERHLPWIHDQVRKRLGPQLRGKAETCDFVQDALIEFLRYGPRFTISSGATFRALLLKIVENTIRHKHDWFTARRRDIARENPLPSETVLSLDTPRGSTKTPSQSVAHHEEEAWVRLGLEVLDPQYREVLVLRKWDTLSFDEIGARLKITGNAAKMRHRRAVDRLAGCVWALRSGNIDQALMQQPAKGDS